MIHADQAKQGTSTASSPQKRVGTAHNTVLTSIDEQYSTCLQELACSTRPTVNMICVIKLACRCRTDGEHTHNRVIISCSSWRSTSCCTCWCRIVCITRSTAYMGIKMTKKRMVSHITSIPALALPSGANGSCTECHCEIRQKS